ncbi:MAG: hypothetical protein EXR98_14180 [Gemmataceae bacterium]|nr:hypothetical protein [Gemmataceae bacterium]
MSKPISLSAQPIPTGILVSVSDRARKLAPPMHRQKAQIPSGQTPWAWIATGVSIVWVLVLAVLAIQTLAQEHSAPATMSEPIAVSKPKATHLPDPPAAEPVPGVGFEEAIPDPDIVMVEPKPNRIRPIQVVANDGWVPLIEIGIDYAPEPPPQVVPVPPKRVRKPVDLAGYADPEQIGSDILFLRDQPEAFKRAKAEKKMVFMVHLSGNLEDKECT